MNGARSIFMRTGYWLTALAAIVLLAASPGTASAQSVGFVGIAVPRWMEGASPAMQRRPRPSRSTFRRERSHRPGTVERRKCNLTSGLGERSWSQHDADDQTPLGTVAPRTADKRRIWLDSARARRIDATAKFGNGRPGLMCTRPQAWPPVWTVAIATPRFPTTATASSSWSSSIRAVTATGSRQQVSPSTLRASANGVSLSPGSHHGHDDGWRVRSRPFRSAVPASR